MARFVELITTNDPHAHIIAGMLKNNGIRSMIAPDTLSSVFPLPDSNVGEVTVAVAEADLERARELIAKE